MGRKYLTRPQVKMRYGGVSDPTITRWINAGRISKPILLGNRHYFAEDELEEDDRKAADAYERARAKPPKNTPPLRHKTTIETTD